MHLSLFQDLWWFVLSPLIIFVMLSYPLGLKFFKYSVFILILVSNSSWSFYSASSFYFNSCNLEVDFLSFYVSNSYFFTVSSWFFLFFFNFSFFFWSWSCVRVFWSSNQASLSATKLAYFHFLSTLYWSLVYCLRFLYYL